MSASILVIPAARIARRERLAQLLDAMAYGRYPADCCKGCRHLLASPCDDCTRALADVTALEDAVTAVRDAATDTEAIRIYDACLMGLAGITSGGGTGTQDDTQGGE